MIRISLSGHQMNGEYVPVIEVWSVFDRQPDGTTGKLICAIPYDEDEEILIAAPTQPHEEGVVINDPTL